MFGLEDFLMGNLMPNLNFNGAAPTPPIPAANTLGLAKQPMGIMGGLNNMMNPISNGLNMPSPMAGQNMGAAMQPPPLPQSPGAPNANAGVNPAALGVNPDQSNPLKNDMMRKLMLMQFLTKQQGKPEQSLQSLPNVSGGPQPGGGMGGTANTPTAPVSSMPYQMPARKNFLTGNTFGGGNSY